MSKNNGISPPAHVGIILDGNRRWARAHGKTTLDGHKKGAQNFKDIALHAFDTGIMNLSAYIFSSENWQRTEEEVGYLMNLVVRAVDEYLEEFNERGIKIVILGRRDGLRKKVLESIKNTESKTARNINGTLALCFNYGGRQEIVDSVNSLAQRGKEITEESISKNLYSPDLPDVDLLIRTSDEMRTSGFMLWRSAYAEMYFSPVLWPAFTSIDFDSAIEEYNTRERRYGE